MIATKNMTAVSMIQSVPSAVDLLLMQSWKNGYVRQPIRSKLHKLWLKALLGRADIDPLSGLMIVGYGHDCGD